MNRVYNWYGSLPKLLQVLMVFCSTLICVTIIFFTINIQIKSKANEVMEPYADADNILAKHFIALKKPAYLQEKYFTVLKTQQLIMSRRKAHHLQLGKIFFRNYYAISVLLMSLSCIGGIVLFVLINRGWAGAGPVLRAFFLSLVFCITFCGFFPLVFKQEDNLKQNMKSYMDYTKAEVTIFDQLSKLENPIFPTKTATNTAGKVSVILPDSVSFYWKIDSMIAYNNNTINALTNYVLSMDVKEIKSMGDVYKMIYNYTNGSIDSLKANR